MLPPLTRSAMGAIGCRLAAGEDVPPDEVSDVALAYFSCQPDEELRLGRSGLIGETACAHETRDRFILGLATIQGGVKILINIEKNFLEDGTLSLPSLTKPEPTQPEKG